MKLKSTKVLPLLVAFFLFNSCNVFKTALFDQHSYQQTVTLKVESLALMDKASEPYANHQAKAEDVLLEMQKMVEYEKNKENNNITHKMWEIMANEERNLMAGFLKRWKNQGPLNQVFVTEAKGQIAEAYDVLIKYESKKSTTNQNALLNLINNQ